MGWDVAVTQKGSEDGEAGIPDGPVLIDFEAISNDPPSCIWPRLEGR